MAVKITCSQLEQVRENPIQFARDLAQKKFSSFVPTTGIFGIWKQEAKSIIQGLKTVNEAKNSFIQRCVVEFKPTEKNLNREENLVEQFQPFSDAFNSLGLEFMFSKKAIEEHFHNEVILKGFSWWVARCGKGYKVFFISENENVTWQEELRSPIFQYHLATKVFKCSLSDIGIGYYCTNSSEFNFHSFTKKEIDAAITETKYAFTLFANEYKKVKAQQ